MVKALLIFIGLICSLHTQAGENDEKNVLKIALSAAFVSEHGLGVYKDIISYIGKKMSVETELVDGLSYKTINGMISDGAIQAGFVCGLPYILLKENHADIELLVAPVMKNSRYKGKPVYFSDLIVSHESRINSISDLRGKVFVFNEKISNSGYNLPRKFFLDKKLIGKKFFKKIIRSGSHEASIKMVANGEADYSFVDSLVLEYDRHRQHKYASKVKTIYSLGPSAIPPVIVSLKMPERGRLQLKNYLTRMHQDSVGRRILDDALVEKFIQVSYKDYSDILEKWRFANSKGVLEIK